MSRAAAFGKVLPLSIQPVKQGQQGRIVLRPPLPPGQEVIARLYGREGIGKGFLANGILTGNSANADAGHVLLYG